MMDLMYFGYDFGSDSALSRQNEIDFIKEVNEKFPNVKLKNAYDSIKGYRQEVWLKDEETDNYMSFLFGRGWFELSLTLQIDMMTKEKHDKVKEWLNLAKTQYPEAFKPQTTE